MRVQVRREDDSTSWYESALSPNDEPDLVAWLVFDARSAYRSVWRWAILDTAEDYTAEGSSTTREGAERDVTAILRGRGYTVEGA